LNSAISLLHAPGMRAPSKALAPDGTPILPHRLPGVGQSVRPVVHRRGRRRLSGVFGPCQTAHTQPRFRRRLATRQPQCPHHVARVLIEITGALWFVFRRCYEKEELPGRDQAEYGSHWHAWAHGRPGRAAMEHSHPASIRRKSRCRRISCSHPSSSAPRLVLPDFPETRARCAVLYGATGRPRRRLKGGRGR
jgi:hypothetical protein